MKDEIIICDCSSAEHQMVLRYDDDKDLSKMVFVEIHLVPLVWYKRLWRGLKYIFGYKCKYGDFEEIILSPKHARQVYFLYRRLNKPNREKVLPDEFKEIVGDNLANKATELKVDVDTKDNGLISSNGRIKF